MGRVIIVVLDSVGMGEMPDAASYHDVGANTLGHIAKNVKGFALPHLQKLGLGNINGMVNIAKEGNPIGSYGRLAESSAGKDTTTGHWEIAGIILEKPFPVYPNGFPVEVMQKFEQRIKSKTLGNFPASGTEIIAQLGEEHMKTGYPIVYTSADSVFQIAAHEGVIPIETLYSMCSIAREILDGEHAVGRVIARPFEGAAGNFVRTSRRKDFSLKPPASTMLDFLKNAGLEVKAVGKIEDIFAGQGITEAIHTNGNMDGVDKTLSYMAEDFKGLIFTNLVDFDMKFGHRNDVDGYANALMDFDKRIPELMKKMKDDDILFITADHGCDPTYPGTDHTREYVPLLIYGNAIKTGIDIGTRGSFADIAKSVLSYFQINNNLKGENFLNLLL